MGTVDQAIWTWHQHADEVPWVDTGIEGARMRLLHGLPGEEFAAFQMQAAPGIVSALHRHLGPVHALTSAGRWGHDPGCEYRPGTYVYEPVDVLHRFYSADQPVDATFFGFGGVVLCDPETEQVVGTATTAEQIASYFEACEEACLPRPNVVG